MPRLGQGTWRMGEDAGARAREVAALRLGLDLGLRLIDTAEMYGEGGAETVVGEALASRRDRAFLVSKVYPHNAGAKGAIAACERSLARLRTDRLDLYLLHWRGRIPLAETVGAFERLVHDGKIARWGVSNFDVAAIDELLRVPGGRNCAANQILYHLGERGAEWRLLERCRAAGITVMAYSPLGQGDLLADHRLKALARDLGATPAQLALAWVLAQPGVVTLPKAVAPRHLREDAAALTLRIDGATLRALDAAFPPPRGATPLAML
jgi:diketogulonate reductase-like aldo/keto reductase